MNKKNDKFMLAFIFSLSIVALLAICYLPIFLLSINTKQISFEQEKWSKDIAHRYRMIDSLEIQLIGKTEKEVEKLLGKANEYIPTEKISYFIGAEYIDDLFLNIYFENGKVKDFKIIDAG